MNEYNTRLAIRSMFWYWNNLKASNVFRIEVFLRGASKCDVWNLLLWWRRNRFYFIRSISASLFPIPIPCIAIIYTFMLLNILLYVQNKERTPLRWCSAAASEHFVGTGVNCSIYIRCMLQLQFRRSTATRFTQKKMREKTTQYLSL